MASGMRKTKRPSRCRKPRDRSRASNSFLTMWSLRRTACPSCIVQNSWVGCSRQRATACRSIDPGQKGPFARGHVVWLNILQVRSVSAGLIYASVKHLLAVLPSILDTGHKARCHKGSCNCREREWFHETHQSPASVKRRRVLCIVGTDSYTVLSTIFFYRAHSNEETLHAWRATGLRAPPSFKFDCLTDGALRIR